MSFPAAARRLRHAFRCAARTIRRSRRAVDGVRPVAEAAEPRVLLASFAPYISAAPSVLRGDQYEVTLGNSGAQAVTSWTVNWGDDTPSTTFNDVPLTTRATHPYTAGGNYAVTATANSATRTNVNTGGLALDPTFDGDGKAIADVTAGNDYGYAMALQPDGKIVMAGWVGSDFGLIRFNADGSRDMTFDDGAPAGDGLVQIQLGTASDRAFAIALDPSVDASNPRIVVAGSAGGDFALIRLDPNGTLDTTFNATGKRVVNVSITTGMDEAFAVAVRPDGRIVAAGYATVGGDIQFAAAQFNVDGSFDNTFSADGKAYIDFTGEADYAQALAFQGEKLVLGGRTLYSEPSCGSTTTSNYDFLLARLNGDGSLDDDGPADATPGDKFGPNGKVLTDFGSYSGQGIYDSDYSLVIEPASGKIVAAGDTYDAVYGGRNFAIARYLPDGSLDTTFAGTGTVSTDFRSNTDDTAYAVALQDVGGATKILAAGYSRGPATTETRKDFALMRYNDNGTLDTTFGTGGKVWSDFGGIDPEDEVRALAIDPKGRIIAAGHADKRFAVARYLPGNKVAVSEEGPPAAPGGLTVAPASASQIDLSWRDRSVHESGYRVERFNSQLQQWEIVGDVEPSATGFSDSELTAATTYRYRVSAFNAFGENLSTEVTGATSAYGFGVTVFRPFSGDVVPEGREETDGASIYRNGNDNKDKLVKVVLTRQAGDNTHSLGRTTTNINVWADDQRQTPLLGPGSAALTVPISFSGETTTVWMEWDKNGGVTPTFVELTAQPTGGGGPVVDRARVAAANHVIIGFAGHTQGRGDPEQASGVYRPDRRAGVQALANRLRTINNRESYNVHLFAEDPDNENPIDILEFPTVKLCGDGAHGRGPNDPEGPPATGAYDFVTDVVANSGVTQVGIFGYSHGGSTARLLTHRLYHTQGFLRTALKFTAYIDAVRIPRANEGFDPGNPNPEDKAPGAIGGDDVAGDGTHGNNQLPPPLGDPVEYDEEEYRYPYLSPYHLNLFQHARNEPRGGVAVGADLRGGPMVIPVGADVPIPQPEGHAPQPQTFVQMNVNRLKADDPDYRHNLYEQADLDQVVASENVPANWGANQNHGQIQGSRVVHGLIRLHLQRAIPLA